MAETRRDNLIYALFPANKSAHCSANWPCLSIHDDVKTCVEINPSGAFLGGDATAFLGGDATMLRDPHRHAVEQAKRRLRAGHDSAGRAATN